MELVDKLIDSLCCDEILEFWVKMDFEVMNHAALICALKDRGIKISLNIITEGRYLTFRIPTGVTQGRKDILEALADIEQSAAKLRKAHSILSIFGEA